MPDVYSHFEGTLRDNTPFEIVVHSRNGVMTFLELRAALRGEGDLVYNVEVTVVDRNSGKGISGRAGKRAGALVRSLLLDDKSGVEAIHALSWNTSTGPPVDDPYEHYPPTYTDECWADEGYEWGDEDGDW